MAVNVSMHRNSMHESWGFRLQGGTDFRMQLSVKKVVPGSPADGRLHSGDAILAISNQDARNLTHEQAQSLIKRSGNQCQMTIQRGSIPTQFSQTPESVKPKGPIKFSPAVARGYARR